MSKVFLHNPDNGAPIKNWYDGSERWSIAVGEIKAFSTSAAQALTKTFGFLEIVSEEESEAALARLESLEANTAKVKIGISGALEPKSDEEIKTDRDVIKTKKTGIKKLLGKIKDAGDAKPEDPPYSEWKLGELVSECARREIDIVKAGFGSAKLTKEKAIQLLENDDKQHE